MSAVALLDQSSRDEMAAVALPVASMGVNVDQLIKLTPKYNLSQDLFITSVYIRLLAFLEQCRPKENFGLSPYPL
jgi:hypothetical protein